MKDLGQWISALGVAREVQTGALTWRLTGMNADVRGVRFRYRCGDDEVVVRLDPRGEAPSAYALTTSLAVSHGALPERNLKSALALVSAVSKSVLLADDGELVGKIAALRRGFSTDDSSWVRDTLRRLPGAGADRANGFIDAIAFAVASEDVPVWVVEPSFRAGTRGFRASVNATLIRAGQRGSQTPVRRAVQTWRRLCVAAGVPAVVPEAHIAKWVNKPDHHAYVGVDIGATAARAKLYFHAPDTAFLSFVSIVPVLGFNASWIGDAQMICADYDLEAKAFTAFKTYERGPGDDIHCTRRTVNGAVLDRSVHTRLEMDGSSTARWLSERGDPELGELLGRLIDDGVVRPRVFSDGDHPTVYTAVVRHALPPVEGAGADLDGRDS